LHLEELYQIVDGVILNFFGRGGQVVGIIWWCLNLVPVSSAAFFDDHHCVDCAGLQIVSGIQFQICPSELVGWLIQHVNH